MPFSLKTASATYQGAMTSIFHNMLHYCLEDYVGDIFVKSKEVYNHDNDLRKVFLICR